ncbi:hypothetical protein M3J09_011493 [Ascochyta lentis]
MDGRRQNLLECLAAWIAVVYTVLGGLRTSLYATGASWLVVDVCLVSLFGGVK